MLWESVVDANLSLCVARGSGSRRGARYAEDSMASTGARTGGLRNWWTSGSWCQFGAPFTPHLKLRQVFSEGKPVPHDEYFSVGHVGSDWTLSGHCLYAFVDRWTGGLREALGLAKSGQETVSYHKGKSFFVFCFLHGTCIVIVILLLNFTS